MCSQILSGIKSITKKITCISLCKACSFPNYSFNLCFLQQRIYQEVIFFFFPKQGVPETKVIKFHKKNRKLLSCYECVVSA